MRQTMHQTAAFWLDPPGTNRRSTPRQSSAPVRRPTAHQPPAGPAMLPAGHKWKVEITADQDDCFVCTHQPIMMCVRCAQGIVDRSSSSSTHESQAGTGSTDDNVLQKAEEKKEDDDTKNEPKKEDDDTKNEPTKDEDVDEPLAEELEATLKLEQDAEDKSMGRGTGVKCEHFEMATKRAANRTRKVKNDDMFSDEVVPASSKKKPKRR